MGTDLLRGLRLKIQDIENTSGKGSALPADAEAVGAGSGEKARDGNARCGDCGCQRPRGCFSKAQLTKHRRSPTCKECVKPPAAPPVTPSVLSPTDCIALAVAEASGDLFKSLRGSASAAWPPVADMTEEQAFESIAEFSQSQILKVLGRWIMNDDQIAFAKAEIRKQSAQGFEAWKRFALCAAKSAAEEAVSKRCDAVPSLHCFVLCWAC